MPLKVLLGRTADSFYMTMCCATSNMSSKLFNQNKINCVTCYSSKLVYSIYVCAKHIKTTCVDASNKINLNIILYVILISE